MKPKLIFIAIFYLIFTNFSFSEEVTSRPFVDKKVAGLIIGEDSIEKVIKLYGRGVNLKTFHGETLCYYDAGEQTYFIVSTHVGIVETITLTEEFNDKKLNQCKKRTIKIMPLATSRGVKIGDSPQKVTRIYGEPHKKETKDEMLIFEYHTDYKEDPQVSLFYDAYLYFRENRLVKFAIHDGE